MDFQYDKKKIKQLKQLGLSDSQIENKRIADIQEYLLDYNCTRLSQDTGRKIRFGTNPSGKTAIFLETSTGRFCEFYVSADDVILHYETALFQVKQEISNRFYYVN